MKNLKRALLFATLSMVIFLSVFSCINDTTGKTQAILDKDTSSGFDEKKNKTAAPLPVSGAVLFMGVNDCIKAAPINSVIPLMKASGKTMDVVPPQSITHAATFVKIATFHTTIRTGILIKGKEMILKRFLVAYLLNFH